jgi:hypothetical protein
MTDGQAVQTVKFEPYLDYFFEAIISRNRIGIFGLKKNRGFDLIVVDVKTGQIILSWEGHIGKELKDGRFCMTKDRLYVMNSPIITAIKFWL